MWSQVRGYPLQAFLVCHLAYMFSQVDLALFSYALPSIRETFSVSLQAMGWVGGTAGPFSRVDFVQGLGRNTEAVGAAFGLPAGQTAGPYEAGDLMVVIRVDDRYYCCHEGVWFEADGPEGPWTVCVDVPEELHRRVVPAYRQCKELVSR